MINYANIKWLDVANGEGIRISLFVSGCRHRCPGCFNPEAQDFNCGKPFDAEIQAEILDRLKKPFINGLTLLGGEPFEPENQVGLVDFVEKAAAIKPVWAYSGFLWEYLAHQAISNPVTQRLFAAISVIVDGPFVESLKDPSLLFRGSSNQHIWRKNKENIWITTS